MIRRTRLTKQRLESDYIEQSANVSMVHGGVVIQVISTYGMAGAEGLKKAPTMPTDAGQQVKQAPIPWLVHRDDQSNKTCFNVYDSQDGDGLTSHDLAA